MDDSHHVVSPISSLSDPPSLHVTNEPDSAVQSRIPVKHAYVGIQDLQPRGKQWTSIWLRRTTLLAIAALNLAIIVAAMILWRAAHSQNGFTISLTGENRYAWSYGPTAVLIAVASLWRQVDIYTKIMQPWRSLRQSEPTHAENSLLLDYLTPLNIISFVSALRKRHWAVIATIVGFASLKLAVVFSTGLLVPSPTSLTKTIAVNITTVIESTAELRKLISPGAAVDSKPVHQYLGVLTNQFPEPVGLDRGSLFQTWDASYERDTRLVSADVDVLQPDFTCEVAVATMQQYPSDEGPLVTLKSPSCQTKNFTLLGLNCGQHCPAPGVRYYFIEPGCQTGTNWTNPGSSWPSLPSGASRYGFLVSNVTYDVLPIANVSWTRETHHNTSAVICSMDYTIGKGKVQYDATANTTRILNYTANGQFESMSGSALGRAVLSSLTNTRGLLLDGVSGWSDTYFHDRETPIFHLILRTLDGEQRLTRLLDPAALRTAVTASWNGVAGHLLHDVVFRPANKTGAAEMEYDEERLHVGQVSLWILVGSLTLLVALSLMLALSPGASVPEGHPLQIATFLSILFNSPTLEKALRDTGHLSERLLATQIQRYKFWIPEHRPDTVMTQLASVSDGSTKLEPSKRFVPLMARYYMVVLLLALPLGTILALELVYQSSLRNVGVVDVTAAELKATYLSQYLSALVMLSVVTAYNAMDFSTALFAPYTLLRSGQVAAHRAFRSNVVANHPLVALWVAMRFGHYASLLSNLAGLVGSLLTVLVSGLWFIDRAVLSTMPLQASLADSWNLTWQNSSTSGDGGAGVLLNQIHHREAVMPGSIWQDYVMPTISLISDESTAFQHEAGRRQYNLTVPAIRPMLDCIFVSDEHIAVELRDEVGAEDPVLTIVATPPLEPACQHAGRNGNNGSYTYQASFMPAAPGKPRWTGIFTDLHLGPWTTSMSATAVRSQQGEYPGTLGVQRDNPPGCPSIGVIFARDTDRKGSIEDVTVLLCSQRLQQTFLQVEYSGSPESPSLNVSVLPNVVEGTSRLLTSGNNRADSFPYRVETYLNAGTGNLTYFNKTTAQPTMDAIFDHLISGPDGIAIDNLTGRANRQRLADGLARIYRQYMSLVIDLKFRTPKDTQARDVAINGTTSTISSRLQMQRGPKIALQVMLAVMTFLGALALYLSCLRDALPRMPSTIASNMALLAQSTLCDDPGSGIDEPDSGWIFSTAKAYSLGWWPKSSAPGARQMDEEDIAIGRRFGIDKGVPDQFGFRKTNWNLLRRRQHAKTIG